MLNVSLIKNGLGEKIVRSNLTEQDLVDAAISTMERATVLRAPQALEVARVIDDMKGRPLGDRILVFPLPPDERFGSIHIPETAQGDQLCGIVVSVGRGKYQNGTLIPPEVKPGNYVLFSKYASRTLKIGPDEIEVFQMVEGDITFVAGE